MISENKHFSQILKQYDSYGNDEHVPEELVLDLWAELKVSKLLMPLKEEGEDLYMDSIEIDGENLIAVYSNTDEIPGDDDSKVVMAVVLDEILEIVADEELDGIVVNPEGGSYIFGNDFLELIAEDAPLNVEDRGDALGPQDLKQIFESRSDESVLHCPLEDLFATLSDSVLLNAVYFDESQDELLNDGILTATDAGGFRLYTIREGELHLAPIFTDKEKMVKALEGEDKHCYGQITILSALFDYTLLNDLDGVVINPGIDDKIIHRDDILSQARGIELVIEDSRFMDALEYAFKL